MVRIEGDSVIRRPVEMVFGFVADQQNESAYVPRMQRAEKIIDGPAGKGTPLRAGCGVAETDVRARCGSASLLHGGSVRVSAKSRHRR